MKTTARGRPRRPRRDGDHGRGSPAREGGQTGAPTPKKHHQQDLKSRAAASGGHDATGDHGRGKPSEGRRSHNRPRRRRPPLPPARVKTQKRGARRDARRTTGLTWELIAPDPLRAPVPTKQHGYEGTGHVLRPTNAYGAAHTVRQRAFSARWIATALRRIRDCF